MLNSIELISFYCVCKWNYARIRTTPSDLPNGYDFCIITSAHIHLHRLQQQRRAENRKPYRNSGDTAAVAIASIAGKTTGVDLNRYQYTIHIVRTTREPAPSPPSTNKTSHCRNNDDSNNNKKNIQFTDISCLQNTKYEYENYFKIENFSRTTVSTLLFNSNQFICRESLDFNKSVTFSKSEKMYVWKTSFWQFLGKLCTNLIGYIYW